MRKDSNVNKNYRINDLWSVREAADETGLSRVTIENWMKAKKIETVERGLLKMVVKKQIKTQNK